MKRKGPFLELLLFLFFITFGILSWFLGFEPGKDMIQNFLIFGKQMVIILPCAFLLIGLFEVWVKPATIEKHFGKSSGVKGYLYAILLAATTVGGVYVAFPVAYALGKKGARLSVIFTYVGASGICRIPMTIFEASFLGLKFTAIRFLVSLPLTVFTGWLLEKYWLASGCPMLDAD